jgi:hypothetical protein
MYLMGFCNALGKLYTIAFCTTARAVVVAD